VDLGLVESIVIWTWWFVVRFGDAAYILVGSPHICFFIARDGFP
jgi:hypothetical protein